MRHIIPISGKDSLATAIVQKAHHPDLNYEYVFNPTGTELPEVFTWLEKVEKELDINITLAGKDLRAIIANYNYFLPSPRARLCTRESKIVPFTEWIGKEAAAAYFGIRHDENRGGFDNSRFKNVTPIYPLKTHKIGLMGVYKIINHYGLKPPTFRWKYLADEIENRFRNDLKKIPEWIIDVLLAGRSRANCFHCFFQALYEIVWLLDTHPNLFKEMWWFECQGKPHEHKKDTSWTLFDMEEYIKRKAERPGHMPLNEWVPILDEWIETRNPDIERIINPTFNWREGYPCKYIFLHADSIRKKHLEKISRAVHKILNPGNLFGEKEKLDLGESVNMTSCGLFCGK